MGLAECEQVFVVLEQVLVGFEHVIVGSEVDLNMF